MKKICVFCGSNAGNKPEYKEMAEQLGREMVKRDLCLVYGGGQVGLMGAIADSVLEAGGQVEGVIPQFLVDQEVAHSDISEQIIVHSMHERKQKMAELADGFITMPGGIGTLEEFFETLTWSQLKLHQKPVALLNVAGYYDKLLDFLNDATQAGFLKKESLEIVLVADQISILLDQMQAYQDEHPWPGLKSDQT